MIRLYRKSLSDLAVEGIVSGLNLALEAREYATGLVEDAARAVLAFRIDRDVRRNPPVPPAFLSDPPATLPGPLDAYGIGITLPRHVTHAETPSPERVREFLETLPRVEFPLHRNAPCEVDPAFAPDDEFLEVARGEATRWSGLLERLEIRPLFSPVVVRYLLEP